MSGDDPKRDPSTAARKESRSGAATRQYKDERVTVKIRGLDGMASVRIHIEHKSGAALIVPFCSRRDGAAGPVLETTGFDGTDYRLEIDERAGMLALEASAPSAILGGGTRIVLARAEDIVPAAGLRVTGDEDTMPIAVKKP